MSRTINNKKFGEQSSTVINQISERAIVSPRLFIWMPVLIAFILIALVAVPSVTGNFTNVLSPLTVDTDPESMLTYDDPVRVTHRDQKKKFAIYDLMVVGVVNKSHENGVFNAKTLSNVHELTTYAQDLQWVDDGGKTAGVISVEMISPSTVDNIEQGGAGTVKFNWLMPNPPNTDAEALDILRKAQSQPILAGSLVSNNGQAIALYIPMTSKDVSYRINNLLKEKMASFEGDDEFFITGLATAQDVFGVEMFQQMGIATPLAMGLIMALLWFFFRNFILILSPLIVANLAVMITMGLLISTGHDVHIMTSMIPIFIMPIAVLDGVHILSEFHDRYQHFKDRKKTLQHVIKELSKPMLLTTITTAIGFFSLNLIPLPPLQTFGTFVAIGVILAWVLTMTIIPAYIMLMSEKRFAKFGQKQGDEKNNNNTDESTFFERVLPKVGMRSTRAALPIVLIALLLGTSALYGVSKLVPNDNPIKWLGETHDIRKSDKVLNEMFAGSYMAYLSLEANDENEFKNPEVLRYLEGLQDYISKDEIVGKTIAITEIIKTVHRELFSGNQAQYRIPDSPEAVAQTLITFQNSHKPNDLWHYVTPDYKETVIWMQLKSGDNQDMIHVENLVDEYFKMNKPPTDLKRKWFGMTHVNVVWQELVTVGVVKAFLGSFIIVLISLIILFRSVFWGALAMVPLTFTVAIIYGAAGLITGNLNTPLAILTSVSIGLAVDYAIHFIVRARQLREKFSNWRETIPAVFGEPARAIARNVIVVGIGFLPLLATPLVPYQMVGILLSSILLLAGIATLVILPALIQIFEKQLFSSNLPSKAGRTELKEDVA